MEEEENQGSMIIGFALGFFLGCFGPVIALVLRGSKTLTGSIIGLIVQVVLSSCLGVGLGVAYFFLLGSSH